MDNFSVIDENQQCQISDNSDSSQACSIDDKMPATGMLIEGLSSIIITPKGDFQDLIERKEQSKPVEIDNKTWQPSAEDSLSSTATEEVSSYSTQQLLTVATVGGNLAAIGLAAAVTGNYYSLGMLGAGMALSAIGGAISAYSDSHLAGNVSSIFSHAGLACVIMADFSAYGSLVNNFIAPLGKIAQVTIAPIIKGWFMSGAINLNMKLSGDLGREITEEFLSPDSNNFMADSIERVANISVANSSFKLAGYTTKYFALAGLTQYFSLPQSVVDYAIDPIFGGLNFGISAFLAPVVTGENYSKGVMTNQELISHDLKMGVVDSEMYNVAFAACGDNLLCQTLSCYVIEHGESIYRDALYKDYQSLQHNNSTATSVEA